MKLKLLCIAVTLFLTASSQAFGQEDPKATIDKFQTDIGKIHEKFKLDAQSQFAQAEKGKKAEKVLELFDKLYAPTFDKVFNLSRLNRNNPYIVTQSAGWAFNLKAYQRDLLGALIKDEAKGVADKIYEFPPFVNVTNVQNALPKDSCLVEFVRFKETPATARYLAWFIPSDTSAPIYLIDIGTDGDVDKLVATMYGQVSKQVGDPNESLSTLRDMLFPGDVWTQMQARQTWIVAPTADLWLVPFAALPLPANSAKLVTDEDRSKAKIKEYYALEKHRISYVISGRELVTPLAARTKAATDNWSALVVGNARYGPPFTSRLESSSRLDSDVASLPAEDDLEFVGFFRNRRLRRFHTYSECPCVPPCYFQYPRPPQQKGHLAVGELYRSPTTSGPDFTRPSAFLDIDFGPNPGLEIIVKKLQAQLKVPVENLLQNDAATATAFRNRSPSKTQLIAFAGHGFYLDPRGEESGLSTAARKALLVERLDPFMRCGLAFAHAKTLLGSRDPREILNPGSALENGILTGHEVLKMELNDTALTLLIACQTGVGDRIPNGDSLATVRQSFQIAGCPLVLATSWEVRLDAGEKDPTTLIINRFVDELTKKNTLDLTSCDEAIRTAQLANLFQGKEKDLRREPFFWAAWSITGYSQAKALRRNAAP